MSTIWTDEIRGIDVLDGDDNPFPRSYRVKFVGVTISRNPATGILTIEGLGGGSGEVNTGANIGGAAGIFAGKVGPEMQFRSIQGTAGIAVSVVDDRIVISGAGVAASIDHGDLAGLADDDHLQYLPRSGARPMTGPLRMENLAIAPAPVASTPTLFPIDGRMAIVHPDGSITEI
jgi:hypothetical protein